MVRVVNVFKRFGDNEVLKGISSEGENFSDHRAQRIR